jgi:hypothetical protein
LTIMAPENDNLSTCVGRVLTPRKWGTFQVRCAIEMGIQSPDKNESNCRDPGVACKLNTSI